MSNGVVIPNEFLRCARLGVLSPSGSGRRLSRREFADAVNVVVSKHYRVDANYIGKIERGLVRYPSAVRRQAFREILGVDSDAQLGFFPRAEHDDAFAVATAGRSPIVPSFPRALPVLVSARGSGDRDSVQASLAVSYTMENTSSGGVRVVFDFEPADSVVAPPRFVLEAVAEERSA